MELFSLNGIVATVALALKIILLFQVRIFSKKSAIFVVITLLLIIQNSIESLGFLVAYQTESTSILFLHLYDVVLCLICVGLVYLATTAYTTKLGKVIFSASIIGAVLVFTTQLNGQLIQGIQFHQTTATSIPGPLYGIFLGFLLLTLFAALGLLAIGSFAGDPYERRRCKLLLFGLSPMFLVGISVAILRIAGVDASAAKLLPLATTFFVAVALLDDRKEYVALSIKWATIWKLARMKDVIYKNWCDCVEEEMIKGAIHFHPDSQRTAGEAIGLSQSTVSRKLEKLEQQGDLKEPPEVVQKL
jgi:hypothetical protein